MIPSKIIDLTHTYETGQLAGDSRRHPRVELCSMGKIKECGCNTSSLLLGSHTGTHMDAPYHMIAAGKTIDDIDVTFCTGDVTITDFRRFKAGEAVQISDIADLCITERMLFVFGWSEYYGTPQYTESWPYLSLEAAGYLVAHGMKLLVTDTLSPDKKAVGDSSDYPVHKLMFKTGVNIIESAANTGAIDFSKQYSISALPLKLKGLDGSPCRVILTEKEIAPNII